MKPTTRSFAKAICVGNVPARAAAAVPSRNFRRENPSNAIGCSLCWLDQSALTSGCEVTRATCGDSQASCQRLKGDIHLQDKEFSALTGCASRARPLRLINLLAVPEARDCGSRWLKENACVNDATASPVI